MFVCWRDWARTRCSTFYQFCFICSVDEALSQKAMLYLLPVLFYLQCWWSTEPESDAVPSTSFVLFAVLMKHWARKRCSTLYQFCFICSVDEALSQKAMLYLLPVLFYLQCWWSVHPWISFLKQFIYAEIQLSRTNEM